MRPASIKKILIIRLSSIGDIILTTPVVRCLKKQYPDCQIHYLTKPSFENILKDNPYIHTVHNYNDKNLLKNLQAQNFSYILDLHNNIRSFFIKKILKKPFKTVNKLNFQKWILVNFKYNCMPAHNLHIVERYLQTINFLGVKNDNEGLNYFIPTQEQINIQEKFNIAETQKYVAIAVGAQHYTKQITVNQLVKLCLYIQYPIILLGAKHEHEKAESIKNEVLQKHNSNTTQIIVNACGMLSLHQSASVVQQAHVVVSPDTGLMHIAAAFQKNLLSVWGSTVPEFGMYPYFAKNYTGSHKILQNKSLNCRPCSKIGHKTCPKKHFNCINNLNMLEAAEWINELFLSKNA